MNEDNKIENLKDIMYICELNELITNFSVINEYLKQVIMYISIKKGKKEEISLEDIDMFDNKYQQMRNIIDKIVKY